MRIHPFAAIRVPAHRASEVSCPPYDIVEDAEARALAVSKPNSFIRVVRPETDFPPEQNPYADEVYDRGLTNLNDLLARGYLVRERDPKLFVYRQSSGGRRQAGLVCCLDVDDYRTRVIRRHELTRPVKVDDRAKHMMALGVHAEAVLLAVAGAPELARQLSRDMNDRPLLHFTAKDGTTHTLWSVNDPAKYAAIFAPIERVYIADGHHRTAAAEITAERLGSSGGDASQRIFGVCYPAEELHILPYHRLVRLGGSATTQQFLAQLRERGPLAPMMQADVASTIGAGSVGIFAEGRWWRFTMPAAACAGVMANLDVARLSQHILAPLLGITDERTDPRLSFAGSCGAAQLEVEVREGRADIAFALHATSMAELMAVADADLIMPPKSTWFDPKIRSGIFLHAFVDGHED